MLLLITLILFYVFGYAQFPAPMNFKYEGEYTLLDESGFCEGMMVSGPYYCSNFSWDTPVLSDTDATLVGYRLYYEPDYLDPEGKIILLKETVNNWCDIGIGVMGTVWVTAVYSNPNGESAPSNKMYNKNLPISINSPENEKSEIIYDRSQAVIKIEGDDIISTIEIFNLSGLLVKFVEGKAFISTDDLQKGFYIAKITNSEQKVISLRFTK